MIDLQLQELRKQRRKQKKFLKRQKKEQAWKELLTSTYPGMPLSESERQLLNAPKGSVWY
jgi:hypothetical protein